MTIGIVGTTDALSQTRQLHVGFPAWLDGQGRIEITLGLAPQLGLDTQAAEAEQKLRIPRVAMFLWLIELGFVNIVG